MEPDGNKLASGYLFCNTIYKYTGMHKSNLYIDPCKRQKSVTVSMRTVSISNLDIKVWNQKK